MQRSRPTTIPRWTTHRSKRRNLWHLARTPRALTDLVRPTTLECHPPPYDRERPRGRGCQLFITNRRDDVARRRVGLWQILNWPVDSEAGGNRIGRHPTRRLGRPETWSSRSAPSPPRHADDLPRSLDSLNPYRRLSDQVAEYFPAVFCGAIRPSYLGGRRQRVAIARALAPR